MTEATRVCSQPLPGACSSPAGRKDASLHSEQTCWPCTWFRGVRCTVIPPKHTRDRTGPLTAGLSPPLFICFPSGGEYAEEPAGAAGWRRGKLAAASPPPPGARTLLRGGRGGHAPGRTQTRAGSDVSRAAGSRSHALLARGRVARTPPRRGRGAAVGHSRLRRAGGGGGIGVSRREPAVTPAPPLPPNPPSSSPGRHRRTNLRRRPGSVPPPPPASSWAEAAIGPAGRSSPGEAGSGRNGKAKGGEEGNPPHPTGPAPSSPAQPKLATYCLQPRRRRLLGPPRPAPPPAWAAPAATALGSGGGKGGKGSKIPAGPARNPG